MRTGSAIDQPCPGPPASLIRAAGAESQASGRGSQAARSEQIGAGRLARLGGVPTEIRIPLRINFLFRRRRAFLGLFARVCAGLGSSTSGHCSRAIPRPAPALVETFWRPSGVAGHQPSRARAPRTRSRAAAPAARTGPSAPRLWSASATVQRPAERPPGDPTLSCSSRPSPGPSVTLRRDSSSRKADISTWAEPVIFNLGVQE